MKRLFVITSLLLVFIFSGFSSESATSAFVEGCRSYSQGDWSSAKIILRKAISYSQNVNPDTYYMLIASEINDGDNKEALEHCNTYLSKFSNTVYYERICYLKGKTLYNLGENENAIIILSDFCHQNEEHELYSYALFYIGEALFAEYNYDEALLIFQQILQDFPDSPKTPAAQYRIESIKQREREEKLLYLLKQTGEEYLSAKEDYEKQLRLYNADSVNTAKQKLLDAQMRNEELERQVVELEKQLLAIQEQKNTAEKEREEALERAEQIEKENIQTDIDENTTHEEKKREVEEKPNTEPYDEKKEQLRMLKNKALEAQKILNNKN